MSGFGAITIERQYASGGSEIGKLVAEKLGISCHDHELLDKALDNCGVTDEERKQAGLVEETTKSSLLFSLSFLTNRRGGSTPLGEKIFNEEAKLINHLAGENSCVFVGRCAGYILKNKVKALNVFVYSDFENRFDRAINVYGISEDDAQTIIKRYDKRRESFYHANTGRNWQDKENYHLFLNSGKLGFERCADIIVALYNMSRS